MFERKTGIGIPKMLIPDEKINMRRWSVIACDQYVSDPRYWEETEKIVGGAPSTLRLMVPEAYLGRNDASEIAEEARNNMYDYVESGVIKELPEGVILVERKLAHGVRKGLMLMLDLEEFDPSPFSNSIIRPTEETIKSRLGVRINIRLDAPLEMPHVLALADDENDTLIGPVFAAEERLKKLYDFTLMQNGGQIAGYFCDDPDLLKGIIHAMEDLVADGKHIYVGDGNHSFAAAKEAWEKTKLSLPPSEQAGNPMRYILVELLNLFDPGVEFLPIHRAVCGVTPVQCLQEIVALMNKHGLNAKIIFGRKRAATNASKQMSPDAIYFESRDSNGRIELGKYNGEMTIEHLQPVLEEYLADNPASRIEYVHGDSDLTEYAETFDSLCFRLPAMRREEFTEVLKRTGVFPKKAFSIGEADEKRFYLECRLLVPTEEEQKPEQAPQKQKKQAQPKEKPEKQDELVIEPQEDEVQEAPVQEELDTSGITEAPAETQGAGKTAETQRQASQKEEPSLDVSKLEITEREYNLDDDELEFVKPLSIFKDN